VIRTAANGDHRSSARELELRGVVQGVGFRPFVHRLAAGLGLAGSVRNEAGAVRITVEGRAPSLDAFEERLTLDAPPPPLARIDEVEVRGAPATGRRGFTVAASDTAPRGRLPVSPDVALCSACEAELFDPGDRRYRYPFITCTDCGPRFTVIEAMPYDRERSTMGAFVQCPRCRAEYTDPSDRRYHSETNSCPECGPVLALATGDGEELYGGDDALLGAGAALRAGRIVAVRGLGGFHLAVDATDEEAVGRLRARKSREAKPLAIMVRDVPDVRGLTEVVPEEERLLTSPERPIVLLRRRVDAPLARGLAPGLDTVGVMIAYTPLHRLLLEEAGRPLVMTSGNASDEPIAKGNGEARRRLGGIADLFLLHDREIVIRCDDSVVRATGSGPVLLRRSRGHAPLPLELPVATPVPLVAVGPHLKNTFTLAEGRSAYPSQHVGDLETLETLEHFEASLDHFRSLFRIEPRVAVRDRHPAYLSTRVAEEMGLERVLDVQHHHAHAAAVLAEHGLEGPALAVVYDGTGYGDDGRIWGAELLVSTLTGYRRVGRLRHVPLAGGDAAVRAPWRIALGYRSLEPEPATTFPAAFSGIPEREVRVVERQIATGLNAPEASSMGRLFDAAAAVLGVRRRCRYEAEAAMVLEALAGRRSAAPLPFPVRSEAVPEGEGGGEIRVLDPLPLLTALDALRGAGVPLGQLAARFHESVAETTARTAEELCREEGLERVVLGGGVFQNARLLDGVAGRLEERGLEVLLPRRLGPNDGAVSYGQAAVAAARLRAESDGEATPCV